MAANHDKTTPMLAGITKLNSNPTNNTTVNTTYTNQITSQNTSQYIFGNNFEE